MVAEQKSEQNAWYLSAMERLVSVVQQLSHARNIDTVTAIVRDAARNLTGSDGATFVLRDGHQCYYADENAIEPLWKGKRFPMSACVSGWVMNNAQAVIIEDIYSDPRVPVEAYRPTFVKSMAMVPVRRDVPIAAIGNYWASHRAPTEAEMAILQALADTVSVALENADLYKQLQNQVLTLRSQQVRISEQHSTLETFTRALSHDLKEPVRTMMAFTQMIREGHGEADKRDVYFQYIQNAADRMGMLIDAVFQYTQLDDPGQVTKVPCAMQTILHGVEENLAQLISERGASIVHGTLPEIEANPAHMLQILQNLIVNAIRHNDDKVTVQVQAEAQGRHWLFSVRDNGEGMASDHIEKIFLPFKRLKHREGHAGLGLAVCWKIVTSYGGRMWCESSPGQGATFFFTMPRNTPAEPIVQEDAMLATVLIVDDRDADIELTREMFRHNKLQCNMLVARDGDEAHSVLKKNEHRKDKVDLVLLDINMPGMDGFELLERIRKDTVLKDLPVVMCTGSVYEQDKRRAEALNAVGYVVKPPSLDKLQNAIERISTLTLHHEGNTKRLMCIT